MLTRLAPINARIPLLNKKSSFQRLNQIQNGELEKNEIGVVRLKTRVT